MPLTVPDLDEPVIVRSAEAEVIGQTPTTIRLLADSSSTGGAVHPAGHAGQRRERR